MQIYSNVYKSDTIVTYENCRYVRDFISLHPLRNPPPLPPTHPHTKSWIGIFVKIHLLQKLKLELHDFYHKSYSFKIILGEMDCIK